MEKFEFQLEMTGNDTENVVVSIESDESEESEDSEGLSSDDGEALEILDGGESEADNKEEDSYSDASD